jgi:hypothetical protein
LSLIGREAPVRRAKLGDIRRELSARGRLSQLGLIEAAEAPRLSLVVRRLLALLRFGAGRLGDSLLGRPARASLGWSDFERLGELRDLAARIVAAAGKRLPVGFAVGTPIVHHQLHRATGERVLNFPLRRQIESRGGLVED